VRRSGIPDGVQAAVDFICAGIESGLFTVGEYLPVISALSRMAGVSAVTMSKAQVILKRRKILSGLRGQKTRVVCKPPANDLKSDDREAMQTGLPEPLLREEACQRIHRLIQKDILHGVYRPGALLPLVKQLNRRYRASPRTIRKVLMLLCEKGLVVPQGRQYAVARLSTADSRERIGVLIQQFTLDRYNLGADEVHNYLREIESQAATIPVSIAIAALDQQGDQWMMKEPCTILSQGVDHANMKGYILSVSTPAIDYRGLCARLARTKKPVSVLDFDGGWTPPSPCNQPYAVFPVGVSSAPGEKVANYLLSLGHHHAAFFAVFHKSRWSRMRYQGLRNAYAEAGYPDCPQLFWRSQDEWQTVSNVSSVPGPSDLSEAPEEYDAVKNRIRIGACLQPLFEQAIASPDLTAWVAANDAIAVCALEFLRARAIEVPGRITLISFDDSVTAMTHRITSYNFNIPAIVSAAFRHVLQCKEQLRVPPPRTVEIPGAIVERETTGRAPKKTV
jgi:DNA-binding LacI/PurR family transcriptional regulator